MFPIHIGGHSPAAARRAGRYGDGFFPTVVNPEKLKELFALVRSEAEKAGRDPAAIEFSSMVRSTRPDDLKALADIGVSRDSDTSAGNQARGNQRDRSKNSSRKLSRGCNAL